MKKSLFISCFAVLTLGVQAQTATWVSSTENETWKQSTVKLQRKASATPNLEVKGNESIVTFKSWGTCFNELGWDALNLLPEEKKEAILKSLFAADGDLRFSTGRIPMNANDYARDWYSSDEVDGDFQLTYFNIDRDKTTLVPYIKSALKFNPSMTFWISPWSPPSWMKINHYYSVVSNPQYNKLPKNAEIALFEGSTKKDESLFPKQLAVNDYFIQDPRYLKTYANYFCKFISAYKEQDITITKAMFQNEPFSYTAYPGCAWTPEGIIRFNTEYLAPALKQQHPGVDLYFGTLNSNRFDFVDQVLSGTKMAQAVKGVAFQWEGGQILSRVRSKYPNLKYMQSESECGWGSFDWKSAEHTFGLMNHYLGNGCEEYTFWNCILSDSGTSGWGWKQNALIRVDSKTKTATLTPEYYAAKHYSHFLSPGTRILAYKGEQTDKMPILVTQTPQGTYVVVSGNFSDKQQTMTVKLANNYLNATLQPHSMNTFQLSSSR